MSVIPIIISHQGKKHEIELDTSGDADTLKYQIFSVTGVEPENQTVLMPKGKLKSDTDMASLKLKPKQLVRVLGSASGEGSALVVPTEKPKFMEDLTEAEAARMEGATPAGLVNLGNTCYLNSTIQILRAMPELRSELADYKPSSSGAASLQSLSTMGLGALGGDMTSQLRNLLNDMADTQEGFNPFVFLQAFRQAYPQFAQKDKTGRGFAQQDAEEAWTQIIQQVKQNSKGPDGKAGFVDRYLTGSLQASLAPPAEAADSEVVVETQETFDKLRCNIDNTVHHLSEGIMRGLTDEIEKRSETLGRDAVYTKTSRLSRLPAYLTVQFVRFFWKKDISKKAKILKKVTFPEELDVVDFCTEDLRKKLIPVRDQVRNYRKDEQDMERARKRQKVRHQQEEDRKHDAAMNDEAAPIAKLREQKEKKETKEEERGGDLDAYKTDAEYEAEKEEALRKARKALYEAIDPELAADEASNKSGLYELIGLITHQGAGADSGHYTAYVRKEGKMVDDPKAPGGKRRESDGKWWWFNDDKVSEVDNDRIQTLSGGGESHSALILLYKAIPLPSKEEVERLAYRRSAFLTRTCTCTFAPFPFLVVTTAPITPPQPQILSQRALEKQPVRDHDVDPVAIEDSQLQHLAPALQPQETPPAAQSPPSITHIENQSSRRRSFLEALLARQHRPNPRRNNRAATQRVLNPINYVPRPTPVSIDRQTHLPPGAEPGTGEVHTLLTLPEQRRSRQYSQEGDIVEHSPQLSSAAGSRTSVGLPPNQRRTSGLGSRTNMPSMADEKPNEPEKAHLPSSRYDDVEGQQTQSAAPSRLASQYGMSPHDQPSQPPRRVSSHKSLRHLRSTASLRSHVSRSNTNTNLDDAPPMPPAPQTTGYPSAEDGDMAEELSWGPSHPCYPHLNPHVPMASPEHTTTRIIRIKRDWMVVGDLAPAFSNIYPEILDPLMSEQEFRYIVRHINATLIQAFDPYSTYNWLDGLLGFVTGWIWEDFRPTGIKGKLRELEAWIEGWNREQGSREGIRLISLRRTGYMNLDIQIPDPQVRVVADDDPRHERGPPSER